MPLLEGALQLDAVNERFVSQSVLCSKIYCSCNGGTVSSGEFSRVQVLRASVLAKLQSKDDTSERVFLLVLHIA